MVFFTADCHFGHKNIINYCNRPFKSIEEMDETLINNWNNKVSNNDVIYHIGDFCFGNAKNYIEKLNGEKHFLLGDHDKPLHNINKNSAIIHKEMILKLTIEEVKLILCHWCMRVWPLSHYNSIHLFGHSHGSLEARGQSRDVGVDNNNFSPLSINDIKIIMSQRLSNFNWLKKLSGFSEQEYLKHKDCDWED
jgi:calcineurin-like phosphoesterase family protein